MRVWGHTVHDAGVGGEGGTQYTATNALTLLGLEALDGRAFIDICGQETLT
jgi:hypothetical protein